PNPAGADTSVSADSAPRLRRSLSLGRATRPRCRLGTWSLVASSGPAMTTAPQQPGFTCRQPGTHCQPRSGSPMKRIVPAGPLARDHLVTCGSTVRGIRQALVGGSFQPSVPSGRYVLAGAGAARSARQHHARIGTSNLRAPGKGRSGTILAWAMAAIWAAGLAVMMPL